MAIKVLEKSKISNEEDFQRIVREIRIMKKVKHPNLVQLYEVRIPDGLKISPKRTLVTLL